MIIKDLYQQEILMVLLLHFVSGWDILYQIQANGLMLHAIMVTTWTAFVRKTFRKVMI